MAKRGFGSLSKNLTSPEEKGAGSRPERGGGGKRHEGGFAEGDYGRGPTPYKKAHSGKHAGGQSIGAHVATSGRGGSGIFGAGEQHKGHSPDLEHPSSHKEFEALGGDDGYGTGGKD
jgi:hypothetical protein